MFVTLKLLYTEIHKFGLQYLCIIFIKTLGYWSGNPSSIQEPSKIGLTNGENSGRHGSSCCSKAGGFFCGFVVKEDCRNDDDLLKQQSGEEDALFCTLCNAEVQIFYIIVFDIYNTGMHRVLSGTLNL